MHVRDWVVCLIEPNKFEAQIVRDLLRNAGAENVKAFTDTAAATEALEMYGANIIIASVECTPVDAVAWTKQLRRSTQVRNRKAAVFLTSRAFSRSLAEDCRHAGANALIGKPVSAKILIVTINKVLASPREFIDAAGYVGPCRRAGIVTAGAPKKRRKVDDEAGAAPAPTLDGVVASLSRAVSEWVAGKGQGEACGVALRQVQAFAVNAGDGPLMRACAAFALQLEAKGASPDAARAALEACANGVRELASLDVALAEQREAIAEGVRQAVAKAAARRAA